MSHTHVLESIELLVHEGQKKEALSSIEALLKRSSISNEDRIKLSKLYLWLSEPEMSMKVLGGIEALDDTSKLSIEDQLLFFKKLQMMHFFGAHYLVSSCLSSRSDLSVFIESSAEAARVIASMALTEYDFELALAASKVLLESSNEILDWLYYTDALEGAGEWKQAIEVLEGLKPKTDLEKAMVAQVSHEYHVRSEGSGMTLELYEKAVKAYEGLPASKDKAYLYQWHGIHCGLSGRKSEALDHLESSLEIAGDRLQLTFELAIYYWMERWGELAFHRKVRLYFAPVFSPYRCLLSYKAPVSKKPIHPWLKKLKEQSPQDQSNDCGVINFQNEEIELNEYFAVENRQGIDLVSGVMQLSASEPPVILGELKSRALQCLFGAGCRGVLNTHLFDYIYRQTHVQFATDMKKLNNLVIQLKKMGFKISSKKSLVKIENLTDFDRVLLPLDFRLQPAYTNMLDKHQEFTALEVESFFRVSKSTATRLLKEKSLHGYVEKKKNGYVYVSSPRHRD